MTAQCKSPHEIVTVEIRAPRLTLRRAFRFWRAGGGLNRHRPFSPPRPTDLLARKPISAVRKERPGFLQRGRGLPSKRAALSRFNQRSTDHGKDREESRQEGEEAREGQGAAEGENPVNLTITQAIERTKDLSGEIKAADEMERLTADTLSAKEHEVTLARQAHDKAVAAAKAKRDEREQLAEHVSALIRTTGEPPPLAENGPDDPIECAVVEDARPIENVFSNEFYAQAMANGADRITSAFNEATR